MQRMRSMSAATLVAVLAAGCAGSNTATPESEVTSTATLGPTDASSGDPDAVEAVSTITTGGLQVEGHDTVHEMADAADVVILGEVVDAEVTRFVGESTSGDGPAPPSFPMVGLTLSRDRERVNGVETSDVVVEFMVQDEQQAAEFARDVVGLRGLFFLRYKGDEDAGQVPSEGVGWYRLVNSYGLVTDSPTGSGLAFPNAPHAGDGERENPFGEERKAYGSLEDLAEDVGLEPIEGA